MGQLIVQFDWSPRFEIHRFAPWASLRTYSCPLSHIFPSLLCYSFFFFPFHFLLETTTFHLLTRILPKMSTYIIIYFCYITISRSTIVENREQRFLQFNWHIRCACTIARIARKRYRRKMKRNKKKKEKKTIFGGGRQKRWTCNKDET